MEILLTSEQYIKEVTHISDNLAGKYLLPSIREAQEIGLRSIIGEKLLNVLKKEIKDDNLTDKHRELVKECQMYLAYQSMVELLPKINFKAVNAGVATTPDEKVAVEYHEGVALQQNEYRMKSDMYRKYLQQYLRRNIASFPELLQNDCNSTKANLHSFSSCGIFLGGVRGRKRR